MRTFEYSDLTTIPELGFWLCSAVEGLDAERT
jgi:hypothetical protein